MYSKSSETKIIKLSVHEVNKLSFNATSYEEIATLLLLKIHIEFFFYFAHSFKFV